MFHVRTRSLPREALLGSGACGFAAGSQGYSKFYSYASIYGTDGCREGAWCARIVRLRSALTADSRYESVQNQALSLSQRAASEMGARHASKTAVALRKTDAWGCGASDCETLANYKSLPLRGDS